MKLVIIGGVAGGASAAARARRVSEEAEIILIERGPDISFANCGLPYHIGGQIEERERLLVTTPKTMQTKFNIDVRVLTEATAIDRERKVVTLRNVETGESVDESYDKLVLSPGAEPVRPPIKGIDSPGIFTLRNLADMDAIIRAASGKSKATIIGAGYIGLEMAEALRDRNMEVTLVELAEQVMGPADADMASMLHSEIQHHGVDLRLGTSVTEFKPTDEGGLKLILSSGDHVDADFAVLAIGVRPEVTLARDANLELGETGGIKVNDHMCTSDPDIYAVGDAVEVIDFTTGKPALIPLAGPANRQGRIAADNIFGKQSSYKHTQGSAICKVFHLSIAMTGLSEKSARRHGIAYDKVYVHPASHASYYPGAHTITLKLLFNPEDGRVLGAQAVGLAGVDKRIDVLAMAVRSGLTVFDLEEAELCYAPPYGSAKDPVNYAGFTAANILRGDAKHIHVDQILKLAPNQKLLDVRTSEEVAAGTIPGSAHIPLHELRSRLDELDRDRQWIIFCQAGLRGYLAYRILAQNGIDATNLDGGYKSYKMCALTEKAVYEKEEMHDDAGAASAASSSEQPVSQANIVERVNACGLQCPGPIGQLRKAIDSIQPNEAVEITATDPGFVADVPAWCHSTGNKLIDFGETADGSFRAVVAKGKPVAPLAGPTGPQKKKMTNVIFANDLDKAMAALIIANGAAVSGYEVTLFFTFWGLSLLRKPQKVKVKKGLLESMFGMMLPRGVRKLNLSKMHMAGMGTGMMNYIMKKKNVIPATELLQQALDNGVRIVACTMTMDIMGLKREELIDGVEEGGVALYVDDMASSTANLFIA
jgi:NADPH-dependent 2,4-dienoyl-CoA reductase/sulfur reductase-like enzyme/peroxiredoxin family protein/rhodanese-related sulfurtransferase/TusA-related sulfurtransferase